MGSGARPCRRRRRHGRTQRRRSRVAARARGAPEVSDGERARRDGGVAVRRGQHAVARRSNRLRTGVRLANREVFRSAEERPEWAGMGTTLTAALVEGARVLFANVGDSRLYAYPPGGAFQQKTRDDSLMGMLADAPGVDIAALEDHPMKHLLTNVLGRKADLEIEVHEDDARGGRDPAALLGRHARRRCLTMRCARCSTRSRICSRPRSGSFRPRSTPAAATTSASCSPDIRAGDAALVRPGPADRRRRDRSPGSRRPAGARRAPSRVPRALPPLRR